MAFLKTLITGIIIVITIVAVVDHVFILPTLPPIQNRNTTISSIKVSPSPLEIETPTSVPISINQGDANASEWGVAKRVENTEYGWSMRVGMDKIMATPTEIFDALNKYRAAKGVHGLNWDGKLGSYAQERANYIYSIRSTDDHKGFISYIENSENRNNLGFLGLGENASYGYQLSGTHVIEWMYASDPEHDSNQLSSNWSDVGTGVSGTATSIIFGYDRF